MLLIQFPATADGMQLEKESEATIAYTVEYTDNRTPIAPWPDVGLYN